MAATDIFRRRRRAGYLLPVVIALVAAAGVAGWYYSVGDAKDEEALSAAPADLGSALPAAVAAEPVAAPQTPPAAEPQPGAAPEPVAADIPVAQPVVNPEPVTLPAAQVTESAPALPVAPAAEPAPATAPAIAAAPASLPSYNPGTVMADAKRLMDSGDLLGARAVLNPAITSGTLPASDQKLAMDLQQQINKTLIFSPRRLPNDEWVDSYTLQSGDMLQRIAPRYSTTAKMIQRINNIADARRIRAGQTLKVVKGPFHAVVSKGGFTMDIYLGAAGGTGSLYVCTMPVGLGMDDSTPVGTWEVARGKKLVNPKYYSPRGEGIFEPDDPKNPLGEYWIGLVGVAGDALDKSSYGIHGTIEPDTIGKMASLGCIRMLENDISLVYDMLVEGQSTVIVKP